MTRLYVPDRGIRRPFFRYKDEIQPNAHLGAEKNPFSEVMTRIPDLEMSLKKHSELKKPWEWKSIQIMEMTQEDAFGEKCEIEWKPKRKAFEPIVINLINDSGLENWSGSLPIYTARYINQPIDYYWLAGGTLQSAPYKWSIDKETGDVQSGASSGKLVCDTRWDGTQYYTVQFRQYYTCAEEYRGMTHVFSCYAKLVDGAAGRLKILGYGDFGEHTVNFDSSDWKKYSINFIVPAGYNQDYFVYPETQNGVGYVLIDDVRDEITIGDH